MDRVRGEYVSQKSIGGSSTPGAPASPLQNRNLRSGSAANSKRPQNTAAKAAAQRLAQVMSSQGAGDESDEGEDDLLFDYDSSSTVGIGLSAGRGNRPSLPSFHSVVRDHSSIRRAGQAEQGAPVRLGGRLSQALNSMEKLQPPSVRSTSAGRSVQNHNSTEEAQPPSNSSLDQVQPPSARSTSAHRSSQAAISVEQVQPPSARSMAAGRTFPTNSAEQPLSAKSVSGARNSNLGVKTFPLVPPSIPIRLRPQPSMISGEIPTEIRRDKSSMRLSLDMGSLHLGELGTQNSTSALQDELDMLQEENDSLLEKLRLAEERCDEAETRAKQLEQQVANLGQGVSLEARLLNKKEASLQLREAALKIATKNYGGGNEEIQTLRAEAEISKDEASSALEQLLQAEKENKSMRVMTQRIVLTQEEMEEVVLKRCWLARYWSLCVQYDILAEIARARYEFWSSFAPLPVEVVVAAGQMESDENSLAYDDTREREKILTESVDPYTDGNIESMLFVEKGLRELTSLKVLWLCISCSIEESVALAMAQTRRGSSIYSSLTDNIQWALISCSFFYLAAIGSDDPKLPIEGQPFPEVFELTQEESEDFTFKRFLLQSWLLYFWKRAKNHGLEQDIADDRIQFWIDHNNESPTSNDAVNVERGLMELRKLGLENQLWEESRRLIDEEFSNKMSVQSNF
ncbi:coiled-coil domain-containing protein SCD2-like [Impatiens glandulifera]|uniref:coiled-coil domain-containing protein SCD2-like n=1 Tax=Impatiens glandulifera TaxID=253017 RepID=UPI001FB075F5|nr:coiled-coil domain-containing protein SCD2-like [Impatiens glandulifera]